MLSLYMKKGNRIIFLKCSIAPFENDIYIKGGYFYIRDEQNYISKDC
jgi:hypothetical protein